MLKKEIVEMVYTKGTVAKIALLFVAIHSLHPAFLRGLLSSDVGEVDATGGQGGESRNKEWSGGSWVVQFCFPP